jgi:excisionase family DNA binding protein
VILREIPQQKQQKIIKKKHIALFFGTLVNPRFSLIIYISNLPEAIFMKEDIKEAKAKGNFEEVRCKEISCFFSIAGFMLCTGLSRATIHRQIKAGNIPIVRIGSRVLIPRSFLETLQNAAEITAKEVKR